MKKIYTFLLLATLSLSYSVAQTSTDAFQKDGDALYEGEEYEKAAEVYQKGVEQYPENYKLVKSLANSKHKLDLFDEAIKWYDAAEKINDSDADLFYARGAAKVFKEEYKKAIKDFEKSIELDPSVPEVFYFKGFSNYELSRYKESVSDYSEAIRLNPDYAAAYYNRGAAKAELKSFEAGTKDFEIALEKNPDLENGRINIALSKLGQKKYAEAIADFDKVIALRDKNLAKAFYYRGEAYYEMKNKAKACDDWQKSSNLGNENATSNVEDFCGSETKPRREIDIVF